MELEFERIRGKDGPKVEEAMQAFLDRGDIREIEEFGVHRDASGATVYSVFYWRDG